ncbi:hypothetical protein Nepgr_022256 [Nepenthes gracilis]|uniref:TF-B3 domain-containing protein n=1 Tax=Nepenthes gracilis TaxID=150966 RepID=A0AAD3XY08_NEPGR|nr:hypothetical protein Nepgr_022256 [Nepenthes gracilis]
MDLHGADLIVEMEDGFEALVVLGDEENPSVFQAEEVMGGGNGGWGGCGGVGEVRKICREQNDLIDVSDQSLFFTDFPPLPDIPFMSSSSSSSFTPELAKPTAGSSSSSSVSPSASAASLVLLSSDAEVDHDVDMSRHYHPPHHLEMHVHGDGHAHQGTNGASLADLSPIDPGVDGADCMHVMESFGCTDILDRNDIWDPSPLFEAGDDHPDNCPLEFRRQEFLQNEQSPLQPPLLEEFDHDRQLMTQDVKTFDHREQSAIDDDGGGSRRQSSAMQNSEDVAMVFFEWLKSNKESLSAEDLRNIKIKKSTIECAARRLGGGKEGMKQLLKLILQWVQNHHLQNKRLNSNNHLIPNPNPMIICKSNSNNSSPPEPNPCFSSATWPPPPPPPYIGNPTTLVPPSQPPAFAPMVGYMGPDANASAANGHCYPPTTDYHMLDRTPSWPPPPPHFTLPLPHYNPLHDGSLPAELPHPHAFVGYGCQYPYSFSPGAVDGVVSLGCSVTKEARKKRMARQKRLFSHHHKSHTHRNNSQNPSEGDDNWAAGSSNPADHRTCVWLPAAGKMHSVDRALEGRSYLIQHQTEADKKQGWKAEKNLRFLLQKVLKQSDVGNLGRIVLPKKEAETHLPELEERDGIPIAMEDIATSRVWNMRYRFWPNNKSRMYLLENTDDQRSEGPATDWIDFGDEQAGKEAENSGNLVVVW